MLGGARSATRTGRLRAPHPVYPQKASDELIPELLLDARTFRIFQRKLELTCQRLDRRAAAFPRAFGFEPQVAYSAAPRGDDTANRAIVTAIRVILIKAPHDIWRDPDERSQRGRRLDAVLPAAPRRAEHHRDLLEVVDEEPFA